MDWNVSKSKDDTQRFHLNKILADIRATIDALGSGPSSGYIIDGGDSTSSYSGGPVFDMGASV